MTPEGEKPHVHRVYEPDQTKYAYPDCPTCLAREKLLREYEERSHTMPKNQHGLTSEEWLARGEKWCDKHHGATAHILETEAENERLRTRLREYEEGLRAVQSRRFRINEALGYEFVGEYVDPLLSTPQPETETR